MGQYEWKGRGGPFLLELPKNVFRPTHVSKFLAETLEISRGDDVIDVGSGCGFLSFVARALGANYVHGVDASKVAVETAWRNAVNLGVANKVSFYQSNLFDNLPVVLRANVIIGDVSGIPDALAKATGWYPGGPTGAELPVQMLHEAPRRLKPAGRLYLPTGTIQADKTILAVAQELFGRVETLITKQLPLPSSVVDAEGVKELLDEGIVQLKKVRSRFFWTLSIHRCSMLV